MFTPSLLAAAVLVATMSNTIIGYMVALAATVLGMLVQDG